MSALNHFRPTQQRSFVALYLARHAGNVDTNVDDVCVAINKDISEWYNDQKSWNSTVFLTAAVAEDSGLRQKFREPKASSNTNHIEKLKDAASVADSVKLVVTHDRGVFSIEQKIVKHKKLFEKRNSGAMSLGLLRTTW